MTKLTIEKNTTEIKSNENVLEESNQPSTEIKNVETIKSDEENAKEEINPRSASEGNTESIVENTTEEKYFYL